MTCVTNVTGISRVWICMPWDPKMQNPRSSVFPRDIWPYKLEILQNKRTCQAGLSLGVMLLRQRNIFREITHNVARREGVLRLAATRALYCATRFAVGGQRKNQWTKGSRYFHRGPHLRETLLLSLSCKLLYWKKLEAPLHSPGVSNDTLCKNEDSRSRQLCFYEWYILKIAFLVRISHGQQFRQFSGMPLRKYHT